MASTPEEWMQEYSTEKGQMPSDPTQFHNFVKNRGGSLTFGQARLAVKAASPNPTIGATSDFFSKERQTDKAASAGGRTSQPNQPSRHDDGDWMNSNKWALTIQAIGGTNFQIDVRPSCTVAELKALVCTRLALDEDNTVKLLKDNALLDIGDQPLHKFGVSSRSELVAVVVPAYLRVRVHVYQPSSLLSTEERRMLLDVPLMMQILPSQAGVPAINPYQICRVDLEGERAPQRWDDLESGGMIKETLSLKDKRTAAEFTEDSLEFALKVVMVPPPD